MDNICLYIEVPNEYNNYFAILFNGINFEQYYWNILFIDIFCSNSAQQALFSKKKWKAFEINELMNYENYYVTEIDIKGYKENVESKPLKTVDDFLNSQCEFMFLLYDCCYIHFYCKNVEMLETVYANCQKSGFKIEKKTVFDVKNNVISSFS